MKNITLILASLIISASTFAQTNWYPQSSGTNTFLFDVHFIDQYEGWLCGNTGLIMHTSDGGANWVEQDAPANNTYYDIHFADSQNGWASGYGGKIIHTTDGGETWEQQETGTTTYLYDIFFLNADTGWVVGGDGGVYPSFTEHRLILYTNNGGITWTHQVEQDHEYLLRSVHFTNYNNGYAVGESGTVLHTSNGGTTWEVVMEDQSYHFTGVSAVNSSTAFVVGEYLGLPHVPVIFKTTDSGNSWDSQTFSEGFSLNDIYFPDENHGWAVGGTTNVGTIYSTSDGGETWIYEDPGTDNYLVSVFFTDNETGWAVGQNGTVISTVLFTDIEDVVRTESFQVYPNPATDKVNISLDVRESAPVIISLINSIGQVVYRDDVQLSPGQVIHSINTGNLNTGYYLAIVENGSDRISRRVVIRK